jgi:geranylgeranyl diphosphate synthase, type II
MTPQPTTLLRSSESESVDTRLAEFFAEREGLSRGYGVQYPYLWRAARRASDGGKRFRPLLVIRTHDELGGTHHEAALDVATAFELLHTAFLLHDDLIDNDHHRRGQPNLAGGESNRALGAGLSAAHAQQWGDASAILAGDLLIHFAQSMVARIDLPHNKRSAILDLLDESVYVTAAGELADVAFSVGLQEGKLAHVLDMSSHKTASYSFCGPLRAGAILAGADQETLSLLADYGNLVGIAFQLRDDLLGVFGDENLTGKSSLGDFRENKITPLIAYAQSTSAWEPYNHLLGKPDLSVDEADVLREMLDTCGALSYVKNLIERHVDDACSMVAASSLPVSFREELIAIAHLSAERVA